MEKTAPCRPVNSGVVHHVAFGGNLHVDVKPDRAGGYALGQLVKQVVDVFSLGRFFSQMLDSGRR
jgi:hypothetical protein